tara:strand:- start:178 stop:417 length:240 start_codon:yes stop_codon:yes gene_type:complete
MILEQERQKRLFHNRLRNAKPEYDRGGVYRYSYEQRTIFYDLMKKHHWSHRKVQLLKKYILRKNLSTLDAYKKIVGEKY